MGGGRILDTGPFFRETTALGFCGPEDVFCLPKRSREDRCTNGTSTSIGAASSTDHQSDSELSAASDDDGKSSVLDTSCY